MICTSLPPLPVLLTVCHLYVVFPITCFLLSFNVSLSLSFSPSLRLCCYFSCFFPFLQSSRHLLLFFLSPPRVTLDPSKRQSSNKSMSGCTLPQGTKTVSKSSFPVFSGCFLVCLTVCLPTNYPVIPTTPSIIRCLSQVGV